jgi:hypothetical protein
VTVMVSLHGRHYRKGRGEAPSKEGGEEGARSIEVLAHGVEVGGGPARHGGVWDRRWHSISA